MSMKLNFTGDFANVADGTRILEKDWDILEKSTRKNRFRKWANNYNRIVSAYN